MFINCVICGDDFNPRSREKRIAGGLRNHCPECADENVIRYAGIAAGEGKQNSVQVLKFNSADDRAAYLEYWKVNSGLYKGKSCQIGRGLKSTPNVSFGIRATMEGNANHKGKA